MQDSIYEFVKQARDEYYSRTIEIIPGYEFSQHETLRTIELYANSRFTTGQTDALGREKPFYNICKFRVNVAVRATDLDTKQITIEADDEGAYGQSFILSLKNRKWMKGSNFAELLNRMGYTRAKFGGVLVKKVEHAGELSIHVVPWRDVITDQVDIKKGVKIERHFYTPADLKEMAANAGWSNVDEAIATASRQQNADITGKNRKNRSLGANIEVWEVHGVVPDRYLNESAPETYSRQMHIVVLDEEDKDITKGTTLFSGSETSDPYKYLAWEEIDGRGLGVGVIEDLFEAQVWTNYSVNQKKDMLDLAGRIIFQTTDTSVAAKNVLTDLESGTILTTAPNSSITQINNAPSSIGAFSQLKDDWNAQAENVTSTYPAILGSSPAHTAFRLQAAINQEATAIFDYRRQEMGLLIQEMYRDWILPFLVKQIQKTTQFVGELTPQELQIISSTIAEWETETAKKDAVLRGTAITQPEADQFKQTLTDAHMKAGAKRKFQYPKGYFSSDFNVDVVTTGEQKDRQAILSALFQIFQLVAKNPQVLQDPFLARLFNQMLEVSGISPALMAGNSNSLPTSPQSTAGLPLAEGAPSAPTIPTQASAPVAATAV